VVKNEIETARPVITPEMIEAGVRASWGYDAPRFVRKLVIKIFRAMADAAPPNEKGRPHGRP
jgi:hypothetical protein